MLIIGCSQSKELAKKIAKELKSPYSELEIKNFPDGETYLRFSTDVKNKDIVLVQTLNPANNAILEVIMAAYTLRDLKAKSITLVAPYLAYMRQDKRFNPGEAVTSKIIGELFKVFDKLITIDPHLHRYKSLNEPFKIKTKKLTANQLIVNYIKKNYKKPIIIGPDSESFQWAKTIAKDINATAVILKKQRISSKKVKITLTKNINIEKKDVIIIDDVISTGYTVLKTIKLIKKQKPKSITLIATHGIFSDHKIYKALKKYKIITTNTIKNKHSKLDISSLIANSLK